MSRIQLALNVQNLDAAIEFYRKLFATEPAKHYEGYANFAIANPPLKLVLFENPEAPHKLNHLGIEVESSAQVSKAGKRLQQSHLKVRTENGTHCCHAVQDKAWVKDPEGEAWEIYTVLEDTETLDCKTGCC